MSARDATGPVEHTTPIAPVSVPPTITGTITAGPALAVTPGDVREWGRTDAITGALRINVLATRAEILAAIEQLVHERDAAERTMARAQAVNETLVTAAERLTRERDDLVRLRDSMLAGARTTSQTIDAIRDALGTGEAETLVEAAERVVRERDEALAGGAGGAGGTFRTAWDALLAAQREGESIAGVVPRLTRERDEAIIDRDEAAAAEVAALERCGYYERSSIARLLGIAPDQLATIGAVLREIVAIAAGRRGDPSLLAAWDAAGRPGVTWGEEVHGG